MAAGVLLCVALALTASVRAEEAEAVITVTDGDSFDKLIKVASVSDALQQEMQALETQPCTLMYIISSRTCNMLAAQPLLCCGFEPAVHLKSTTSFRGNREHMTAVNRLQTSSLHALICAAPFRHQRRWMLQLDCICYVSGACRSRCKAVRVFCHEGKAQGWGLS